MRLWSLHPRYLDSKGLVALWREGLLAQKVLQGRTRGYRNHPQLIRFNESRNPESAIGRYLHCVHRESIRRSYKFDAGKISSPLYRGLIPVTTGQIAFEKQHLIAKLKKRDPQWLANVDIEADFELHPSFRLVEGEIADWEIT